MIDAGATLAELKGQAQATSKAKSQQAKDLRAYKGWPREVAPVVADLAKQNVLDADNFHMRTQSRGTDEWNEIADDGNAAEAAGSADAARIRAILDLPERGLHP